MTRPATVVRWRVQPGNGTRDLERLRELGQALMSFRPLTPPEAFNCDASFAQIDGVIVSKVRFTPLRFDRVPKALQAVDPDFLLFERYFAGLGLGLVDDVSSRIDATSLHLVDMSRHYRTITTGIRGLGVWIPHRSVGFDPSSHPTYTSIAAASWRGRLLQGVVDDLASAVFDGRMDEARALKTGFLFLVRNLMLNDVDEPPKQDASAVLGGVVRAHIRRHLADRDLGADDLCRRFGLSRSTLYRMFEDDGGLRRYLKVARLERCVADLLAAAPARGEVHRIAERWGFVDAGHFNHFFRERFGVPPSSCLGAAKAPPLRRRNDAQAALQKWMSVA